MGNTTHPMGGVTFHIYSQEAWCTMIQSPKLGRLSITYTRQCTTGCTYISNKNDPCQFKQPLHRLGAMNLTGLSDWKWKHTGHEAPPLSALSKKHLILFCTLRAQVALLRRKKEEEMLLVVKERHAIWIWHSWLYNEKLHLGTILMKNSVINTVI